MNVLALEWSDDWQGGSTVIAIFESVAVLKQWARQMGYCILPHENYYNIFNKEVTDIDAEDIDWEDDWIGRTREIPYYPEVIRRIK